MSSADDTSVLDYLQQMLPPSLSFASAPPAPSHNAHLLSMLVQLDDIMSGEAVRTGVDLADGKAVHAMFAAVRSEDDMLRAVHTVVNQTRTAERLERLAPFHKLVGESVSKGELDAILAVGDVNGLLSYFVTEPASDPVKRFGVVVAALLLMSSSKQ